MPENTEKNNMSDNTDKNNMPDNADKNNMPDNADTKIMTENNNKAEPVSTDENRIEVGNHDETGAETGSRDENESVIFRPRVLYFAAGAILVVIVFFLGLLLSRRAPEPGNNLIYVGEVSLEDYRIVAKSGTSREAKRLSDLIYKSTGYKLKTGRKAGEHNIFLSHKTESDVFSLENGDIYLLSEGKGLGKLVDIFANTYLGISFAGTEREKVTAGKNMSYDTDISFTESGAWIPERETCICLWSTQMPRGAYYNYKTDPITELMSFSKQELYD